MGYDARSRLQSRRIESGTSARETRYIFESTLDTDTTESGPAEQIDSGWASVVGNPPVAIGTGALTFRRDGSLPTSVTWSGPVTGTVSWQYYGNNDLRVRGFIVSNGTTEAAASATSNVSFEYNNDDSLNKLTVDPTLTADTTGTVTETLSHDPTSGLPTGSITAINGVSSVTTTLDWHGFGMRRTQGATWPGTNGNLALTHEYDGVGRMSALLETRGSTTTRFDYGYDNLGRLVTVKQNDVLFEQYTYSPNGNRITASTRTNAANPMVTIDPATIQYDGEDRLTKYGTSAFAYNSAGQLVSRTVSSGPATTYAYDALGNLTRVVLSDGRVIDYGVDALGRRVSRSVRASAAAGADSARVSWLYRDRLEPVAELDASGAVSAIFVYGSTPHTPDLVIRGGVAYRVITDHLGSVRRVVNAATGALVQSFDYDAWGGITFEQFPANANIQPFRFAGGMYDSLTGLTRFGARDYDASVGRWTAKDPIGFAAGDSNVYAYVGNRPITMIDPDGRNPILYVLGVAFVDATLASAAYQYARYDHVDTYRAIGDGFRGVIGAAGILGAAWAFGLPGAALTGSVAATRLVAITPLGIVAAYKAGNEDRLDDDRDALNDRDPGRSQWIRDHIAGDNGGSICY